MIKLAVFIVLSIAHCKPHATIQGSGTPQPDPKEAEQTEDSVAADAPSDDQDEFQGDLDEPSNDQPEGQTLLTVAENGDSPSTDNNQTATDNQNGNNQTATDNQNGNNQTATDNQNGNNQTGNNQQTVVIPNCPPGYETVTAAQDVRGPVCRPLATGCPAGQYQVQPASESQPAVCSAITQCGSNQFQATAPTPTRDRVCQALTNCQSNQFETTAPTLASDRNCAPMTACPEGHVEVQGIDGHGDRYCRSRQVNGNPTCPEGYSYYVPDQTNFTWICRPPLTCPEGYYRTYQYKCAKPFISRWFPVAGRTVTIPLNRYHSYSFDIDWGDGSAQQRFSFSNSGQGQLPTVSHTYANTITAPVNITIAGTFSNWDFSLLEADDKALLFEVVELGSVEWKNFDSLFEGASELRWVRGGVTDGVGEHAYHSGGMRRVFRNARYVQPDTYGWNVSAVTFMSNLFEGATMANPDVSRWDTARVTNMSSMFKGASSANPDVSRWNVQQVTTVENMFQDAPRAAPDLRNWSLGTSTNCTNFHATLSCPNGG